MRCLHFFRDFLIFGNFVFQFGIGIFLIINAVYIYSKRDCIFKAYEKSKVLKSFEKLLKIEKDRLKNDCNKIILEYQKKFQIIKNMKEILFIKQQHQR